MKIILFAVLLFGLSASAQTAAPPKPSVPKPSQENVYSNTWDVAEIKSCTTHSSQFGLLICDHDKMQWPDSYVNLLGNYGGAGASKEEATKQAILFSLTHSKTYIVKFSKTPWPNTKPKQNDPDKMTLWDCSKATAMISCKFEGSE
jgi:hypothetical protein